jgi:hypothetical protein
VDNRIRNTDLSKGVKKDIYELFKEARYSDSEEKFVEKQKYLFGGSPLYESIFTRASFFNLFLVYEYLWKLYLEVKKS